MTRWWERLVDAVFSWRTVWTLLAIGAGGDIMLWIRWLAVGWAVLPTIPAGATFVSCMSIAWALEQRAKETRQARQAATIVPLVCRYQGIVSGMHTWVTVEPIAAGDHGMVRVAVGLCATGMCGPRLTDVVVHAVR